MKSLSNKKLKQKYKDLLERYKKAEKYYAETEFGTGLTERMLPELYAVIKDLGEVSEELKRRAI
jgi:preprotein translocase subunit SecA